MGTAATNQEDFGFTGDPCDWGKRREGRVAFAARLGGDVDGGRYGRTHRLDRSRGGDEVGNEIAEAFRADPFEAFGHE